MAKLNIEHNAQLLRSVALLSYDELLDTASKLWTYWPKDVPITITMDDETGTFVEQNVLRCTSTRGNTVSEAVYYIDDSRVTHTIELFTLSWTQLLDVAVQLARFVYKNQKL